jgi:phospholipase/lecithinase/hemolysin
MFKQVKINEIDNNTIVRGNMKIKMHLSQTFQHSALAGLVALGLVDGASRIQAKQLPFSHQWVFGDSLSDTGNLFRLSGGYPPPPDYFGGRFCDGPLWVEYLPDFLDMPLVPEENFAVAGATTGTFNSNNGLNGNTYPGLQNEIDSFLALGPTSEPARALYIVEAGANDFGLALVSGTSPADLIANGVSNTIVAVQRLWNSGARIIMVMNIPDIGVTPVAHAFGPQGPAMLTQLSAAYNQVLELALQSLDQAGIPTVRLDAFAVIDKMYYSPATYGFTNITTPWLSDPNPGNPDQYLFWVQWHPTTGAHKVLAEAAANQLMNTFSPSQGNASLNGLHGLVNAWLQKSSK